MKTNIVYQQGILSRLLRALILFILGFVFVLPSAGQYFGRNKPGYSVFNYDVLKTPDFVIYHNFKNDSLIDELAAQSEYWYKLHSTVFRDTLRIKNPIIIYEDFADFQQTNVSSSPIGVGTGGFTEGLKNRVVMPVSVTNSQTNHVLGHELVHAFQYNMIAADSLSLRDMNEMPLWMIEGLAEYMSIGSIDPQTSMWMRDAVLNNEFPTIKDMTQKPQYNPYRYGQAFWTFTAKMWGDTIIEPLLNASAKLGYKKGIEKVLGVDTKTFSSLWKSASELHYKNIMKDSVETLTGKKVLSDENSGDYNISPVISPNGKYVAFMSEKDLFSFDLFLADAETGKIISKLSSTVKNDEIDAFNFIESAGSWSPDNNKFAYVVFSKGENKLIIVDVKKKKIIDEIGIPGVKAFCNPAWSPVDNRIVLSGTKDGTNNLFIYDYDTGDLQQLTNDMYSYIHPSWSPDGSKLVFSTDKNIVDGRKAYVTHGFDLCILDLKTNEMKILTVFPGAGNMNPVFSGDGQSILFLSDRDGFRNLYRYSLKDSNVFQLTEYLTGISGITLLSPAMSLSNQGQLVYSYYYNQKYQVYSAKIDEFKEKEVNPFQLNYDAATLPPLKRVGVNIVDRFLLKQPEYQKNIDTDFNPIPYQPKFKLDYISNVSVGVANSRLGTGMAGSISALFSDIVGDNQIFVNIGVNGEVYDFGGQVAYISQKKRVNWGAAISHIPYKYGGLSYKRDTIAINGESYEVNNYMLDIYRLFESEISLFGYYPFSTTRRIESGLSVGRYSYRIDRFNNYYDDIGYAIDQSREKLDAPPGFNMVQADVAYVYDNSYFGLTAPLKGARSRYQVMSYMGDYNFISTLIDYRKYIQVKPLTFAFRFYNNNRFGKDSENGNFAPLYIGYPWYIRGYDGATGRNDYFSAVSVDQLQGSKMVVTNVEIRIPLTGPKRLALIKSKFLFTDFAFFVDGGLIWDSEHTPDLKWEITSYEDRIPLISAGASLRVNVFGYMVIEPYYAIPFQDGGIKNASFGLNFLPGW